VALSPSPDIITVDNLRVVYPDGTRAVDDISFRVRAGEFFGFLGPNGAGKSTTIKTLTTLLGKTSGSVSVAGEDLDRTPERIRRSIGVLSQDTVVDVDLTGRENLLLFGRLQHVPREELEKRVDELLKVVELEDAAGKPAGRYSGGMRKRLDLASALVHKPKLLFLDEPTTGLDPQSRAALWEYLETVNRDEGVTIFLTTQYMEEADRLCQRIAIIDHGHLIGGGTPRELKAALGGETIELTFEPPADGELISKAARVLGTIDGLSHVSRSSTGISANAPNAGRVISNVVMTLAKEDIRPSALSVSSPTLDDVFLRLTGRRIRSEELDRKTTEPFLS
jgi:ABC-2 type transport system ATP-binding protein